MYSIGGYSDMVADEVRMRAYVGAFRDAVKPGSIVLDIGTGTGVFALLGCRLGARRVYAIEPDRTALCVAREMAAANGVADRITFMDALSTDLTLPERADVIVADLRGVLPLFQQHIPSMIDARQRLLAPDGILLPAHDRLHVALVEAPAIIDGRVERWLTEEFALGFRPVGRYVTNTWQKARLTPEQLLTPGRSWGTIDYRTVESPDVEGQVEWTAERTGTAHGLAVWFDATIDGAHGFSNAPGQPRAIYGHAFFPLQAPVPIEPGDTITVSIAARLIGGDYIWTWNTTVHGRGSHLLQKAKFHQSTFHGTVFLRDELQKAANGHSPALNEDGLIERTLLELMDGTRTITVIAEELSARFPTTFRTLQAARQRVVAASQRFSRNGQA